MDKKRILLIEDEEEIREGIRVLLDSDEYEFIEAGDGKAGLELVSEEIDLVILDIMMPELDGISVCREIRKKSSVPVLFLTARIQETDKLIGLHSGADDYLTKPFSYMELDARIKALLRRYHIYRGRDEAAFLPEREYIEIDGLRVSVRGNEVILEDREIHLTDIEYQILLTLIKKPNHAHSAQFLYEEIWKEAFFYGAANIVMVHVKNLRSKIEKNPQRPNRIITVWGKGYLFRKQVIV